LRQRESKAKRTLTARFERTIGKRRGSGGFIRRRKQAISDLRGSRTALLVRQENAY